MAILLKRYCLTRVKLTALYKQRDPWCKKNNNKTLDMCQGRELRRCVKVEVAVLGSPSLIVRTVSVDVQQQCTVPRQRSSRGVRSAAKATHSPSTRIYRGSDHMHLKRLCTTGTCS